MSVDILPVLAKREHNSMNAAIKEFDLKTPVLYLAFLPDQLIQPRLSNLAGPIGGGISSAIVTGRGAVQFHPKATGLTVLSRS